MIIWNIETAKPVCELKTAGNISTIQYSRQLRRLVVGHYDSWNNGTLEVFWEGEGEVISRSGNKSTIESHLFNK